ncbi:MAG: hypothetical protein IBJ12_01845 [Sphingomonadaceae bacterium]|nr:hypothetical protein [Sphingomonadaceae bacterium]
MGVLQVSFSIALVLCVLYGWLLGGRTGKIGAAIFVTASLLTGVAATISRGWASTSYLVLSVDAACLLALAALAFNSTRFWPIWAVGFQIVGVATHVATIWIPEIVPKAYHAMQSFWSIPILWVMVAGTRQDRKYERGHRPKG